MRACLQLFLLILACGGALCVPVGEVQAAQMGHLTTTTLSAAQVRVARQPQAACRTITVAPGDWLSRIAVRLSTSWTTLYAQNRVAIGPDPNRIQPGMILQHCYQALLPATTSDGAARAGQPCQSTTYWPRGRLTTTTTPPGCYAADYAITPTHYPHVAATFGGCDWWPAALHPTKNIWSLPRHTVPRVGAAILYAPHEQGAGSEGHWGVIVALSADGRYALSSEMNFTIIGRAAHSLGGWGRVVYRYVALRPPATMFVY
ncbi:MAG: LysM peptidoglycan-binding domain-containing protein [Ktedonobacterales bacterium]|nr:LysM peptidoglycan-binding domain-containing protein [Ktedonobacterales bacterium]